MKHLSERPESQLFAAAAVQPVFDHFNFLVRNALHRSTLGHLLAQQSIKIFVNPDAAKAYGKIQVAAVLVQVIRWAARIRAPLPQTTPPYCNDPKRWRLTPMRDPGQNLWVRVEAARTLLPFIHAWPGR